MTPSSWSPRQYKSWPSAQCDSAKPSKNQANIPSLINIKHILDGYFFGIWLSAGFWLLAFGWLLASGFWLLASGSFGFWLVASGLWLHFSMEGIFFWELFLLF